MVSGSSRTFYVDPQTGNDANAGTSPATAWKNPPGTRTVTNSGFIATTWGAVSATNRINCGDTILLKGGSTQTQAQGGYWRLDPTYYVDTCTAAKPISVLVATTGQWAGSNGSFTFDATGVYPGSVQYGPTGLCGTGGVCGVVGIERINGVKFGGIGNTARFRVINVDAGSAGADGGIIVFGMGRTGGISQIEGQWLYVSHKTNTTGHFDRGAGIELGELSESVIHDSIVEKWAGMGIDSGQCAGPVHFAKSVGFVNITIREAGPEEGANPTPSNECNDDFMTTSVQFDDTMGGGGGSWCLHCGLYDGWAPATNVGGNNSCTGSGVNKGCEDLVSRFRDADIVGNGRHSSPNFAIPQIGFDSSGPSNYIGWNLPMSSIWVTYSRVYGNRAFGWDAPHGSGEAVVWNTDFYRAGQTGTRSDAAQITMGYCAAFQSMFNSIVKAPTAPWGAAPCGDPAVTRDYKPQEDFNIYDYNNSDSEGFANFRWTGTANTTYQLGNGPTFATAKSTANFLGTHTKVSTAALRDDPKFTALPAGTCNSGFSEGYPNPANGEQNFKTCDFHLQSGSAAVDDGTFFLDTNGAGNNSSTITVKPSTPEPAQVTGAGGTQTLPYSRPHMGDPRMYFIEPTSFLNAPADVIQIKGATCQGALATYGSAERARIVRMTSSSITLDRTCSWPDSAGVHLPWNGAAPDAGAYESSFTSAQARSLTSTSVDARLVNHRGPM